MCGRYYADIEILQKPIVIEADGNWHTLPDRIEYDRQRDADIQACGNRVYRFNGAAINKDPDACISLVMVENDLVPDTDPIADIRRMNVGPDNPWWRGGQKSYTCDGCGIEFQSHRANRACVKKFCNQQCYGSWMRVHPEQSSVLARWPNAGNPMCANDDGRPRYRQYSVCRECHNVRRKERRLQQACR